MAQKLEEKMLEEKPQEKKYEDEEGNKIIQSTPLLINNPACDHYYQDDYLDNDNNQHCQCIYCPMGRLYNPDKMKIIDGKLVSLRGN